MRPTVLEVVPDGVRWRVRYPVAERLLQYASLGFFSLLAAGILAYGVSATLDGRAVGAVVVLASLPAIAAWGLARDQVFTRDLAWPIVVFGVNADNPYVSCATILRHVNVPLGDVTEVVVVQRPTETVLNLSVAGRPHQLVTSHGPAAPSVDEELRAVLPAGVRVRTRIDGDI